MLDPLLNIAAHELPGRLSNRRLPGLQIPQGCTLPRLLTACSKTAGDWNHAKSAAFGRTDAMHFRQQLRRIITPVQGEIAQHHVNRIIGKWQR